MINIGCSSSLKVVDEGMGYRTTSALATGITVGCCMAAACSQSLLFIPVHPYPGRANGRMVSTVSSHFCDKIYT